MDLCIPQINHDSKSEKNPPEPQTDTNYLASYIYLTQISSAFCKDKRISDCPDMLSNHPNSMGKFATYDTINGTRWSVIADALPYTSPVSATFYPDNSREKGLLIYGMALHQTTDTFAHSAMIEKIVDGKKTYVRVVHAGKNTKEGDPAADNASGPNPVNTERYRAAKMVANNLLKRRLPSNECGSLSDFDFGTRKWNDNFYLSNFSKFAKVVCNEKKLGSNSYSINFDNLCRPN